MHRVTLCVMFVSLLALVAVSAASQEDQEEPGDVGQVHFVKPKAGETLQWEAAYKSHVEWHHSKNDTWSWPVWEIVTGARAGQYAIGTFFHHWKDLEHGDLGADDNAHARETLDRHTASSTMEVWRYRSGVSNPPKSDDTPAYAAVYYRLLKQGMTGTYTGAVRKINDAIVKADWGVGYYRNVHVNSGEEPMMVRWVARRTWEDFAPPALSFPRLLEDAYGKEEAAAINDALNRSIDRGWSEIWAYRPDLSYAPE